MFGLLCTGLKKFPDEVGERMSLPEALMLTQYWALHPHILLGVGAMPVSGSGAGPVAQKMATRADVENILREFGAPTARG